jgi:hypothetical protein
MSEQASFSMRGRNPDVLTCIANLSNDEVFTPPAFANKMLDTLEAAWAKNHGGANLWADKSAKFLDPFTKSGVYLREITSRLTKGLAVEIPNLGERVDHILTKQVFGVGITHLTSLLARRSLYCSKHADGEHSIAKSFTNDAGNIWFERLEHTWVEGKCKYCGASRQTLDRGHELETHAYALIHTDDIKARIAELFGDDMQFDVIIGNPPYQLDDGGYGTSAAPIYHLFVEQAKKLEPRYLSLVIPARWFAGGKGLDEFREAMLTDNRLRSIDDYLSAADVFPGVGLKGGVCNFLWDRDNPGRCRVTTHFRLYRISSGLRCVRVDRCEVELARDEEDDGLDRGEALVAASAALGGLEQAVERFEESVGHARLCPSDDALEVSSHHRGHVLHRFDLRAHDAGAPVLEHRAHDVDLLALEDLA